MLTLYEELLLLAIHEENGTLIKTARLHLPYGLSGALLAELVLQGKLQINESHRLERIGSDITGDGILDRALAEVGASEKPRKIGYWIGALYVRPKRLVKQIMRGLVEKGIVIEDERQLLWAIPNEAFSDQQASAKYSLKQRLRTLALADGDPNLHEIALLTLLRASGLMDLVFIKDERKIAGRCIHELLVGEALKNPVAQSLEEIGSALEGAVSED
jgi:hypothetical protein